MIRFGPGEENEAAFGAWGSTVVSVLSMVPTGLLQIKRRKVTNKRSTTQAHQNPGLQNLPGAVDIGHDFIELVLSYRERRERHGEGDVGVIADEDGASRADQERACAVVVLAEDDLPLVRASGQLVRITRTAMQKTRC